MSIKSTCVILSLNFNTIKHIMYKKLTHHHQHHHHLFSFHRSVQDYKIQMDTEIVTFEGKQGVKPLQSVHQ